MQQNKATSSRTTELTQILLAASYLQTLDLAIKKVDAGASVDSITFFSSDPNKNKIANEYEKRACSRMKWELACLRMAKSILLKWGWKGVAADEGKDSLQALRKGLHRISCNTEGFVRSYFKANPDVHKFLWWHGDPQFKDVFKWNAVEKHVELPENVKMIMEFFNGELYYPRYNINVTYDRRRIFINDNWTDGGSDRTDRFLQWQQQQPIAL